MPTEQRSRGHDPVQAQAFRQQPGQRREYSPIGPLELRLRVRPAQHGDLLAEDQYLDVLRRRRLDQQRQPGQHRGSEPVNQTNLHGAPSSQVQAGGRVPDALQVYGLFRRWQRDGTWRVILAGLQGRAGAAGLITWDVSVDSTVARAHQHAAGARKRGDLQAEPPGGIAAEPADHGLGRSRGGLTTKVHLACEQGQKPLSVLITAGQRGDSPQFQVVLERIRVPLPGPGRPRTRPRAGAGR